MRKRCSICDDMIEERDLSEHTQNCLMQEYDFRSNYSSNLIKEDSVFGYLDIKGNDMSCSLRVVILNEGDISTSVLFKVYRMLSEEFIGLAEDDKICLYIDKDGKAFIKVYYSPVMVPIGANGFYKGVKRLCDLLIREEDSKKNE